MDVRTYVTPETAFDAVISEAINGNYETLLGFSTDAGIAVYGTYDGDDVTIEVYADDRCIYTEPVFDKEDSVETVTRVFNQFLTERVYSYVEELDPYAIPDEEPDEYELSDDETERVADREFELDMAFESMLMTVIGVDDPDEIPGFADIREEIKDMVLDTIQHDYGIDVFRPTITTDASGIERVVDYPYAS